MPLQINLRHLQDGNVRLKGELPMEELDIDSRDDMVSMASGLKHDLEVQKLEDGLLVQGRLDLELRCKCVRCLKAFSYPLGLETWTRHLPLEGDEATPVSNDCVDLTPYVREDILLEFPQHPLCDPECRGLPGVSLGEGHNASIGQPEKGSPAWNELNKLKF